VDTHNYLGIYFSSKTAMVVCLNPQSKMVVDCFSVSVPEQEQASPQLLASLIAKGCTERKLNFSEVAVALDCAMFMQHSVHSEFSDPRRIAATIRFDTEDALATDITDIALAFEIVSTGQDGSELTVFTSQRKVLSEVLLSLQQNNFDPVSIEPDVNCLSRFVNSKLSSPEIRRPGTMFGLLSRSNGYLIIPPASVGTTEQKASMLRTFILGRAQDRTQLLTREVLMNTAIAGSDEPISHLEVYDSSGTIDYAKLNERLSIEARGIDWLDVSGADSSVDAVNFAIAYGAALTHSEKGHCVNFRDDFSPFQGKKMKLQKALRFTAISVTILLMAIGIYFQMQLFGKNKVRKKLRANFAKDYSVVMLGQKMPRDAEAVRKLRSELGRIKDAKKGLTSINGEKSISSKLTLVLAAFVKCAEQTNLNIKSISITARDIIIIGDTSSRQNTREFFEAIRNNGLEILRESWDIKGGRDSFNITVKPK
jgi:hypothetical protein